MDKKSATIGEVPQNRQQAENQEIPSMRDNLFLPNQARASLGEMSSSKEESQKFMDQLRQVIEKDDIKALNNFLTTSAPPFHSLPQNQRHEVKQMIEEYVKKLKAQGEKEKAGPIANFEAYINLGGEKEDLESAKKQEQEQKQQAGQQMEQNKQNQQMDQSIQG